MTETDMFELLLSLAYQGRLDDHDICDDDQKKVQEQQDVAFEWGQALLKKVAAKNNNVRFAEAKAVLYETGNVPVDIIDLTDIEQMWDDYVKTMDEGPLPHPAQQDIAYAIIQVVEGFQAGDYPPLDQNTFDSSRDMLRQHICHNLFTEALGK